MSAGCDLYVTTSSLRDLRMSQDVLGLDVPGAPLGLAPSSTWALEAVKIAHWDGICSSLAGAPVSSLQDP